MNCTGVKIWISNHFLCRHLSPCCSKTFVIQDLECFKSWRSANCASFKMSTGTSPGAKYQRLSGRSWRKRHQGLNCSQKRLALLGRGRGLWLQHCGWDTWRGLRHDHQKRLCHTAHLGWCTGTARLASAAVTTDTGHSSIRPNATTLAETLSSQKHGIPGSQCERVFSPAVHSWLQAKLYPRILAAMKPGATLGLSHGFLLGVMQSDGADFREDIDVILMAPKVLFLL